METSLLKTLASKGRTTFAKTLKDMVKNNFPDCLSHSILATE
jgi:hypothetical protein